MSGTVLAAVFPSSSWWNDALLTGGYFLYRIFVVAAQGFVTLAIGVWAASRIFRFFRRLF